MTRPRRAVVRNGCRRASLRPPRLSDVGHADPLGEEAPLAAGEMAGKHAGSGDAGPEGSRVRKLRYWILRTARFQRFLRSEGGLTDPTSRVSGIDVRGDRAPARAHGRRRRGPRGRERRARCEPGGRRVAVWPLTSPPPVPSAFAERNLFGEAERIAARAASASTRRQYAGSSAPSATGLLGNSADRPWSAISTPTGPRSRHRRAWLLQ